ncbi:MAG TPA: anthranilate synthase component I [Armatimonadota bacterium]|nr:anthranilate synthase component I [Armatimonadota bacterium]
MYYPSKEEFVQRSQSGNLVPVYREILADMETPVSAYRKIARGKHSFLLESVEGGERLARYSFLGADPFLIFKSKGQDVQIIERGRADRVRLEDGRDPLHLLKDLLSRYTWVDDPDLPRFCGGAVGYIGYDTVRFFERLPDDTVDDLDVPDCFFVFTDTIVVFDHLKHRMKVVCAAEVGSDPWATYDLAVERIDEIVRRLRKTPLLREEGPRHSGKPLAIAVPSSNMTLKGYEQAVVAAKEYIRAGDAIQVVLSQRLSAPLRAEPFDVYRALRSVNPSPYMYFLNYEDIKLIGSSPEILVTEDRGTVTTRPLAGTRPRGKTEEEDVALEKELLADEKERAEHIMLVDLGRNDIGRVCEYGTVDVDELMVIERYSHVMHIVSNVRGLLAKGKDQFDVLRAAFPAGTVSGAPKVRAMEIIEELEPTKRGTYAGAIGYFSFSGNMDTCINIRTILVKDGVAYMQAGAGIVADSVPTNEYHECMNKAGALLKAIEMAEAGLD